MQVFRVDDMTCGHCVSTITKAIKATDKAAKVTIDLAQHLVMVESTEADAQELNDAITDGWLHAGAGAGHVGGGRTRQKSGLLRVPLTRACGRP